MNLVDEMVTRLSRMRTKSRIDGMATLLATTLAARPRLCLLSSVVRAVLDRNVSVETARQSKLDNLLEINRLVAAMAKAVPELTHEQHSEVVQLLNSLVVGLWPDANQSEITREALEDPALKVFRHPFEASVRRGVLLLARGQLATGPRSTSR